MNMKKITAALMSAAIFAGTLPAAQADAELETGTLKAATVAITESELEAQDYMVPVMLSISDNPGFSFMGFGIEYDERLSVVNYQEIGVLKEPAAGVLKGVADNPDLDLMWGGIIVNSDTDTGEPIYCTGNGEFFVVTFEVPKDAKEGDVFEITMLEKTETAVQELATAEKRVRCGLVNGAIVIGDDSKAEEIEAEAEENAIEGGEAENSELTVNTAVQDNKSNDIPMAVLIIGGIAVLAVVITIVYVKVKKKN